MSEEADPPPGFLPRLGAAYMGPARAMRSISRAPTFWAPLLALAALGAAFNAVWLRHIDPTEFVRGQLEASPLMERLSAEERAAAVAEQARVFPGRSWLGPVLFTPLGLVVLAAVYLGVFRFFYGGEVGLKQSLAFVSWTFLAVSLVALPLGLLVMYLREDWNVDPQTALQANLTVLLDKGSIPPAVYSLAESVDLFSAWMLVLLSLGYAAAIKASVPRAAIGVIAVWAVYVLGKAALASFL